MPSAGIIPAKVAVDRVYRFDLGKVDAALQTRSMHIGSAQSNQEGEE